MNRYVTQADNKELSTSYNNRTIDFQSKPIIIYYFVDLTCKDCWTLEPYIRKLFLEYGRFFTVRPIICHNALRLVKHNSTHHQSTEIKANPLISVKAAGLQGNKAGRYFLRNVQEAYFLEEKDIYDIDVLIECAKRSGLDIAEFKSDLYSLSAHKAFQCDIKISNEMNVNQLPTLVFFSQIVEEHTVKISGIQTYDTYVYILKEMLQKDPIPAEKVPLINYLKQYKIIDANELAIIYDLSIDEAILKLKQLQLMQRVKQINKNGRELWSYV